MLLVPFVALLMYAGFQRPVMMVTVAASFGAMMLSVQSGLTLWLQRRLPEEARPGALAGGLLRLVFAFQLAMAAAVVYFVVV